MITKSDFLLYLDTPLHLWAGHNGRITKSPSTYELQLFDQGKEIEQLGKKFLQARLERSLPDSIIEQEKTLLAGEFQARVDVAVFDAEEQVYDIYEIKGSTSAKKEHYYDIAFQWLVAKTTTPVRRAYLVYLNKEYVRQGDLDLEQLFVVEDVTAAVEKLESEVSAGREAARRILASATPDGIVGCVKPERCPCPALCHPRLPLHSIFEIPRLSEKKARDLQASGILSIADIPEEYPLSDRQRGQVQVQKSGNPFIDSEAIGTELSNLQYPLCFLDYETCDSGIPLFNGYKSYQHIVFQFSLHVVAGPDGPVEHFEFLATENEDPGIPLLDRLAKYLPGGGSVIVWNKTFEKGRNSEMAERYPEHRKWLEDVNRRVYDLMDIFEQGYYIHPDFRGSVSIKNVFPVLVQKKELTYGDLPISNGEEAMIAWLKIVNGELSKKEVEQTRQDLLHYCELDTLAMLRIWEALKLMAAS
jgi:hypothetical protein